MLGSITNVIWKLKRLRYKLLGRDLVALRDASVSFIGSEYGGAYVALEPLGSDSVVYSVGVGEDISLDEELIRRTGCKVVGLDPTPRAKTFVENFENLSANYSFVDAGLATKSGVQRFFFPSDPSHVSMSLVHDSGAGHIDAKFLSLDDLMERQGHEWVDLIKIDVEGEEYALFESWLQSGYRPRAGQIWVEFHPQRANRTLMDGINIAKKMTSLGFIPISDGHSGVLLINALSDRLKVMPCVLGGQFSLQSPGSSDVGANVTARSSSKAA